MVCPFSHCLFRETIGMAMDNATMSTVAYGVVTHDAEEGDQRHEYELVDHRTFLQLSSPEGDFSLYHTTDWDADIGTHICSYT